MNLVVPLLLISTLATASWLAAAPWGRGVKRPCRAVAAVVIGWTWLTLGMQGLGAAGLLQVGPLVGWGLVGLVFGVLIRLRNSNVSPEVSARSEVVGQPILLFGCLLLLVWVVLVHGMRSLWFPVKVISDGPIYHLHFAIQWWKAGRLELVASPFGESAATYFPANGNLVMAWLITGEGSDRLARIAQVPFYLAAIGTCYATARLFDRSRASSLLAASWIAGVLPLLVYSFEPNVDAFFVFGYLAAVYFLARHLLVDARRLNLLLSGLGAGLAWGSKATSIVFVPLLLVAGAALLMRQRGRARPIDLLVFLLAPLATCGYWFLRNAILTGNPLYPMHLQVGGIVLLQGWFHTETMSRSQFYIPLNEWKAFVDILGVVVDVRLAPVWVLALVSPWLPGRFDDPRVRSGLRVLAIAAVVNIALYWVAIPYRTQQRFMLHGLGLLAAPLALLFDRSRILRTAGLVLLFVHLLTPNPWPFFPSDRPPPWRLTSLPTLVGAAIEVPLSQKELSQLLAEPRQVPYVATRVAYLIPAALCAGIWVLTWRRPGWGRRFLSVAIPVLIVGAASAWTWYGLQARKLPFPPFDYLDAWTAIEVSSPPQGLTIAYAGTNLPYYLWGTDLRNRVRYVNVKGPPAWQMHQFREAAVAAGGAPLWDSPRPGWDRVDPKYEDWVRNLRALGVELLFVAKANPVDGRFNIADSDEFPIERLWADEHPEQFRQMAAFDQASATQPGRTRPLIRIYRVLGDNPRNLERIAPRDGTIP